MTIKILNDASHPLHIFFEMMPPGRRFSTRCTNPSFNTVSLMAGQILEILKELTTAEFENFTFYLNDEERVLEECKPIPRSELEDQKVTGVVILMKNAYGDKMVKLTLEILKKIDRNDLVQRWESNPKNGEDHREPPTDDKGKEGVVILCDQCTSQQWNCFL
ncbi:hypothetical protein SKAU_G00276420 [Synaphobranchus kaupii]|uniref:Pyrin domain-containing protein n=1 Tax=Synaphobranchus kaupii TaxID=118154 RepID=A0A9Q1F1B5_SYNKA|nr:hypothetical protein SKAU_G00276420 [Synaphobranchus kaupii]